MWSVIYFMRYAWFVNYLCLVLKISFPWGFSDNDWFKTWRVNFVKICAWNGITTSLCHPSILSTVELRKQKKNSTCQGKVKTHAPVSSGCRISDRLSYIMLAFWSRILVRQKHKALMNHSSGIFTENNQQDQYPWKVTLTRHLNFAIRQQWITFYPLDIKDHMLLTCYSSFLCCTYVSLPSFYLR